MDSLSLGDFLDYNFLSSIEASENKKYGAFVVSKSDYEENKYISNIWIIDKETKRYFKLTSLNDEKSFIWLNDDTILFASSNRDEKLKKKTDEGEEWTSYYSIDIRGGEADKYMDIPLKVTGIKKIDENKFIISATFKNYGVKLNYLKGEDRSKALDKMKEDKDYEVLDEIPFWANGKGFINKKRERLYIYDRKENELTAVTGDFTEVYYFSYKEGYILYISSTYKDKLLQTGALSLYDVKNGNTETLIEDGKYNVQFAEFFGNDIICALSDMKKYGVNQNSDFYIIRNKRLEFFKSNDTWLMNTVGSDSKLGGGKDYIVEGDKLYFPTTVNESSFINTIDIYGNEKVLCKNNGSIDSYAIFEDEILFIGLRGLRLQEVYSLKNEEEIRITDFNERIYKEKKLSFPKKINFINDGVKIEGWALEPVDFYKDKKYPCILDIHGGPKTVYGEVFFHEMQVWANMGYFVIFCNPRGGDGRGNEFADIRGKYGTIDYDDLMKFVDKTVENYPQIDSNKLGVTGGSYGGFMTNWIIGHTDRFKCAISQRSISNWISKFGITDIGYYFNSDQNASNPWKDHEKLWWHSPLKYADKVKTPTLFIHSEEDYRCALEEGLQMFTALKYHGVESRLCMFRGENHELSRSGKPKHRVRRLEEITNWFEKYLKNEPDLKD